MSDSFLALNMKSQTGPVLILGGDKKSRLQKAWDLLSKYDFKLDKDCADLLIIKKEKDKKSIGIAEARLIKDFLKERPLEKSIKAVLVEDANVLTQEAQSSLLKILEEPSSFGLIILLSDKEGSLLATVVSRCKRIFAKKENSKFQKPDLGNKFDFDKEEDFTDGTFWAKEDNAFKDKDPLARPNNKNVLYDLSSCSYKELFDLASKITEGGKEDALDFLEKVLERDIQIGMSQQVIYKLESAIREIRDANVNLKFALEYIFLMHKLGLNI